MINYYLLTKPGILLGNLITVAAGFLLAAKGHMDLGLFLATLAGIGFIMASACVCNNIIDRKTDKKMERTKNRAIVQGLISEKHAMVYAVVLGLSGAMILLSYTNVLAFLAAVVGFFVYVFLYSLWKCHTIYGTAIGSIAGATPPVVGYCAAGNQFDAGACILFLMMVLWQMPHFFSVAMYHLEDYTAADIPVLPVKKGIHRTKVHMVFYIFAFIITSMMLTLLGYTGYVYLVLTVTFGLGWLGICLQGFKTDNDRLWGRYMFRVSLVMIMAISFTIPFDIA